MLFQKILHVHHSVAETRARLGKIHAFRRFLPGVEKALVTADGVGQFDLQLPDGLNAHCVVVELPTDTENQVLFCSSTGNVKVSGLIEFVALREDLTEVQMIIDFRFLSLWEVAVNFFRGSMGRFLDRQLSALQTQLDQALVYTIKGERHFAAHLPQLAHS